MKNHLPHASDVQSKFDKVYSVIEKSNDITIVGGGPVGIELLGEIGFKFPKKNITLIQVMKKYYQVVYQIHYEIVYYKE